MIVMVTGSRSLTNHPDRLAIKAGFIETIEAFEPTQLIHGGAAGPDSWAAMHFDAIEKMYRPDKSRGWRTPAQQLFDRNEQMVHDIWKRAPNGAHVVACWDGMSSGTIHAMRYAHMMGVPITRINLTTFKGETWTSI